MTATLSAGDVAAIERASLTAGEWQRGRRILSFKILGATPSGACAFALVEVADRGYHSSRLIVASRTRGRWICRSRFSGASLPLLLAAAQAAIDHAESARVRAAE